AWAAPAAMRPDTPRWADRRQKYSDRTITGSRLRTAVGRAGPAKTSQDPRTGRPPGTTSFCVRGCRQRDTSRVSAPGRLGLEPCPVRRPGRRAALAAHDNMTRPAPAVVSMPGEIDHTNAGEA